MINYENNIALGVKILESMEFERYEARMHLKKGNNIYELHEQKNFVDGLIAMGFSLLRATHIWDEMADVEYEELQLVSCYDLGPVFVFENEVFKGMIMPLKGVDVL